MSWQGSGQAWRPRKAWGRCGKAWKSMRDTCSPTEQKLSQCRGGIFGVCPLCQGHEDAAPTEGRGKGHGRARHQKPCSRMWTRGRPMRQQRGAARLWVEYATYLGALVITKRNGLTAHQHGRYHTGQPRQLLEEGGPSCGPHLPGWVMRNLAWSHAQPNMATTGQFCA